jgi:hypothetical protein
MLYLPAGGVGLVRLGTMYVCDGRVGGVGLAML